MREEAKEGPSGVQQRRRFLLRSAAASSNCHPAVRMGSTAVDSYHAAPRNKTGKVQCAARVHMHTQQHILQTKQRRGLGSGPESDPLACPVGYWQLLAGVGFWTSGSSEDLRDACLHLVGASKRVHNAAALVCSVLDGDLVIVASCWHIALPGGTT
jgi:hypothetical protein